MNVAFRRQDIGQIRDSIHGSLPITVKELKLIDQPAFQRLRNIKQMGFADYAFPGATHSRYSHSLGAMHLASRIFDSLFAPGELPEQVRKHFRQVVRLAMLFHDIGHAPLSHSTEVVMPKVSTLNLDNTLIGKNPNRQATHEDYTLKLILDSPLSKMIEHYFSDDDISLLQIVSLIYDKVEGTHFTHNGLDYTPILRQIVTSECDADRMDYLQRDSFYSGVNYGKFDHEWLINNLVPVEDKDKVFMGLKSKAIFSFEDFLLSRYHMFATVYLHHTSIIFEKMLEKYFDETAHFTLPSDIEAYILLDDVDILYQLRKSNSVWAKRIIERRPYYLLDEYRNDGTTHHSSINHEELTRRLEQENVHYIRTHSKSTLSKYFGHTPIPLFVQTGVGAIIPLEDYTPLFMRYQNPAELHRIYIAPEEREKARKILDTLVKEGSSLDE